MVTFNSWTVRTEINEEKHTCVHAHISPEVNIDNLDFTIMDENRIPLFTMKVNSYEIYFCTAIGKPMFAKLGDCVRYVDGTGSEIYNEPKKRVLPIVDIKDTEKIDIYPFG